MKSSSALQLGDYDDDSRRQKSVLAEKVSPPIHLHSAYSLCPALAAVQSLLSRHFCVIDDFISPQEVDALRAEVMEYVKDGRMIDGEIGTSGASGKGAVKKEIRDDVICWLEPSESHVRQNMRKHILRCDVFSQKIQILLDSISPESSWVGAGRTKIMASLYRAASSKNSSPVEGQQQHAAATATAGAKYNPHVDNPSQTAPNGRALTTILYLNPKWKPSDGGELRVKTATECVTIAPLGGRMVCFWPDERVPHEVLPARDADRFAITIWYLDKNQRRSAEAREKEAIRNQLQEQRNAEVKSNAK